MSINVSDYNRNGIFIEEKNNSVVDNAPVQEAIVNFVPGFSKRGTVFNRPVLVKTKTDRNTYFGEIDKVFEKKGSFFHRTIDVALQTGPVWAMNLLTTTSLDQLNYASVSLSAQYDNDAVTTEDYDSFFNKTGFWQRDTESFLFFAADSERMIHFTNVSDKKISMFMFKSSAPGYAVTAETWYGGKDKVPTWMHYSDLISDYIVRVVVVAGDWSNYVTLAADQNWTKYFGSSGLRKEKVDNFIKDSAVTLLGDYTCSLIPYFRDQKNQNIFIETMINLDTDKTGLFCAVDIDKIETDLHNGNIDIIGQTLTPIERSGINFMSYVDTIEETDYYPETLLDRLGNVIGISTIAPRTSVYTNGNLSGLVFAAVSGDTTATPAQTITSTSGYAIINDTQLSISTQTFNYTALTTPAAGYFGYRIDTIYIDQTGDTVLLEGTQIDISGVILTEANAVLGGLTYPATMPNNAIVLGYLFRTIDDAGTGHTNTRVDVALAAGGFQPLVVGTGAVDLDVQVTATNVLNIVFQGTATATKADYNAWRRVLFFNELVTSKVLSTSVISDAAGAKVDLTDAIWTDNYTSGSGDKEFTLTVATADIYTAVAAGDFVFYYVDDEFIMDNNGLETRATATGTANYGVIAKQSEMYQDFYNGLINTGDYFYVKVASLDTITFNHYTNTANALTVGDWILMSSADAATLGIGSGANNLNIFLNTHTTNNGNFSIGNGSSFADAASALDPAYGLRQDLILTAGYYAFQLTELVTTDSTPVADLDVYDYDAKVYLKMYFVGATLTVEFMNDNTLTAAYSIAGGVMALNGTIDVYSGEAAYKQTLEVESHVAYTISDNKFLIDSTRYPEVKVGDYVKAYVDSGALEPGEYPKYFARITKKLPWTLNTTYGVTYSEITTDLKVDISTFGTDDLQTTRYTTIEDYVDTYKAITLSGFTPQSTSYPNGTEARQSTILDVIEKETALYNAIVNKNTFNFRYLIDSFGLGLTEFSKQQLVDICGKRKNCLGFINMPSAKSFKESSSPSFINSDGTLNLEFVKLGGDPESNPAFLYSFAQGEGKDDGRPTVGYFFPHVGVNDNGRPLSFPPAAYAANTYMRKNNSAIAGIYNHTIAAGPEQGKILGISNVEMDFTEGDLEQLFAMGANAIMYAKNSGFYIENEFTALTTPLTSLAYLHVREVLIDLENDLYAMLLKYQYKFNTPAVRAKIKREADAICQKYVDRSGLEAFKNVIDETNNTSTLISNQIGLLQTYIVPVNGLSVIVNEINILASGALGSSTGFTAQ